MLKDENIKTKLEAEVHWSIPKDKQELHIEHIKFALDLVDDVENYDDAMFVFYAKKVDRMRHE